MSSQPILDLMFQALLTNDAARLEEIRTHRALECINLRALISTEDRGGISLDLGLGVTSNVYITSVFEGPRAFFISALTSVQAHLSGGRSIIPLDYTLSFDSNFAEKLRATVYGEKIEPHDRAGVLEVLALRANDPRVQFDVVPFLVENIRFARDSASNLRPLKTLVAFRMLDHLDWESWRKNPGQFDFRGFAESLEGALLPEARACLESLYHNAAITHYEAQSLGTRALLLRFATLWHAVRRDPKRILCELMEFSVFELGFLPVTELSLIWSGIRHKRVAPFFGPIVGRSEKMLYKIRNMAWDMTLLRVMEQAAQSRFGASFFVPHFVSLDQRWRDLMRLNPIRLMLVDDARNSMLFARSDEESFRLACEECTSTRLEAEFTPEKVAARRAAAAQMDAEVMRQIVIKEERPWS